MASPAPSASPAIQKIDRDPNPTIKPGPKIQDDESSSQLSVQNEGQWTFALTGEHAHWLYQLLEVTPHLAGTGDLAVWNKLGANYYCARFSEYVCIFTLGINDGKLLEIPEEARGKKTDADMSIVTQLVSQNLELDPDSKGKFGRLLLNGEDAKRIYEGLTASETKLAETETECDRAAKNGDHVSCERFTPAGSEEPQYSCRLYFDYDTGKFDLIQ